MKAYMLVNLGQDFSHIWEFSDEALKIKGVKKAHTVLGNVDSILYVDFSDFNELKRIITEVTSIHGVQKIQTALVLLPKME